jgi:hypothetical protein
MPAPEVKGRECGAASQWQAFPRGQGLRAGDGVRSGGGGLYGRARRGIEGLRRSLLEFLGSLRNGEPVSGRA